MDGHVLVCGIPGSGKSSCIAIPTLRSWKGTVFAVDIKGELHKNAQAHRKSIKTFEPKNKECPYYYDPYVFLKESDNPSQEARAIAEAILPLQHDAKEPFWIECAQLILTGAILHYYDSKETFIGTLRKIQLQDPAALINIVAKSSNDDAVLHACTFVKMEGKTLAGVSAEISRAVTAIVTDKDLVNALSPADNKSVISPSDLEEGHDVYLKIPEHLLRQWKHLVTLIINQFITFFEKRVESRYNRPILFLLDEFPRLGKIPAVTDALATLRSKNVTVCMIIQSLAQLKLIYGHDAQEVIADTCAFKAVLGVTDRNTQKYFSDLVGTYEKMRQSQSENFDPYVGAPTGHGKQYAYGNDKPVIKPTEFATLREIILLYPLPHNFCRVQKQPYYLKSK
jgi:type IV secretion system protein VirD4